MNELYIKEAENEVIQSEQDYTKPLEPVKYWDKEYINHRIEKIENKSHKLLFLFLWRTGCRISEALAVRQKDVNMRDYFITIRWLKNRRYETRIIPMHPDLKNILDYYCSQLKHNELLFSISRQRADQLAKKYFQGHCHKFRHSFAVAWLKSGGDLYLLSKMLGHSSVQVTEKYLQVVPIDIGKELLKVNFEND